MTISNNPNIIQGILSLTIEPDHVYTDLLESAPFNRGKNKLYEGVPGNLVAYACKVRFKMALTAIYHLPQKLNLLTITLKH